jgi:hypothetical protein
MKKVSVINIEEDGDWLHGPVTVPEKRQICAARKSFKTRRRVPADAVRARKKPMNAETLGSYEEVLSGNGWTRVPGNPNSLILQWRHPTLPGHMHLSLAESGNGWRHYISAPFPHCTGVDAESLCRYLAGGATILEAKANSGKSNRNL